MAYKSEEQKGYRGIFDLPNYETVLDIGIRTSGPEIGGYIIANYPTFTIPKNGYYMFQYRNNGIDQQYFSMSIYKENNNNHEIIYSNARYTLGNGVTSGPNSNLFSPWMYFSKGTVISFGGYLSQNGRVSYYLRY